MGMLVSERIKKYRSMSVFVLLSECLNYKSVEKFPRHAGIINKYLSPITILGKVNKRSRR